MISITELKWRDYIKKHNFETEKDRLLPKKMVVLGNLSVRFIISGTDEDRRVRGS